MKTKKKVILPQVNSKPKYTIELDEEQAYSLGGWLKENAVPLATTVAGAALTATGVGAGVGIPMMVGGASGMLGNALADKPEEIDYSQETRMPRTVGKQNMTPNVMSFAKGGPMDITPKKNRSITSMGKNINVPLTDLNMMNKMVELGYHNNLSQLQKMTPEQRQSYIPQGSPITWEKVKKGTANQGGYKYYEKNRINLGTDITENGQVIMKNPSASYIQENFPNHPMYAMGGEMMKGEEGYTGDDKLMQLKGPKHSQGGIQFTPDAELEGGESVYKDVVNSDQIKITKEIANQYGLPKVAINKTPAEYSNVIEKNYKGREVDPFAQTSKEMELNNLARMSSELKQMIESQQPQGNQYHLGGRLHTHDNKGNIIENGKLGYQSNQYKDPSTPYTDWTDPNYLSQDNILQRNRELYNNKINKDRFGLESRSRLDRYTTKDNPIRPNLLQVKGSGNNFVPQEQPTDQFKYNPETSYSVKAENNINKVPISNLSLSNIKNPNTLASGPKPSTTNLDIKTPNDGSTLSTIMGLAPLAIGAFQAARTAKEGYDKVKLPRVHSEDFNPALIDPSYQLNQVSDTFTTGNEQMSQVSKKDYLRRRIQSATEEARSKSGVLGQVNAANTQMLNQAGQINQQNRMRSDSVNLEASMQEENINAANKGAWQTARDYQLSNLASMAGEYGRDQKLTEANNTYNDRMFQVLPSVFQGQTISKYNLAWRNTDNITPMVNSPYMSTYNKNNDPHLYNSGTSNYIYGDDTELGQGINTYPNQVNRNINSMTRGKRYDRSTGSYINQ